MTVTFVTSLGVHSIVFVRRLSNEARETLKKYLSHLVVINIVDINIGVIFNHITASVRKGLQMYSNALTSSHCNFPAKHECYVSRGSVETLFRWGGKRLHYIMANFISKICIKLCQNWPRFVKDMTKTFWCVFRFTVPTAVHLRNGNANFHRVV